MLKFSFATGCVILRTELWNQHLGFTSQCELSEYLPVGKSTHPSLLELIVLYQRQTQPSIVTPQRAERYNHLALWLPESMCNRCQQGLMGQGWAAWHLPQRQDACPALERNALAGRGKKSFISGLQKSKTKLLAVNVCGGGGAYQGIMKDWAPEYLQVIWKLYLSVGSKKLVSTSFCEFVVRVFCHKGLFCSLNLTSH